MIDSGNGGRVRGSISMPDLTALIDVIFLIVIFLMLTANVRLMPLPIDVPDTDTPLSGLASPDAVVISVHASPPWWSVDETRVADWDSLKQQLEARITSTETPVSVAADKTAPTEPLLKVLAWLHGKQVKDVQVLMEPSK